MKTLKTFFIYASIITISLLIAEIIFRKVFDVVPGIGQTHSDFRKVDSLIVYRGFVTDSDGIFKIDYNAAQDIERALVKERVDAFSLTEAGKFNGQLLNAYHQSLLLYRPEMKFDFAEYCRNLTIQPGLDEVDSAVIFYSQHPINKDGFRSIAFKNYVTKRKKVLLLGDSFTYGQEPQYLFQSFADYLLSKRLVVFNTGINSMDPTQYAAIAKKFIPILKPDFVVVNLCLENDAFYYRRKLHPYVPFYYSTNAGDLYAGECGREYLPPAQVAYQNILAQASIPVQQGFFYPFYTKTAVGTILWQFFHKVKIVKDAPRLPRPSIDQMDYPSCNDDLREIKNIADSNNCKMIIVAIPAYTDTGLTRVIDYPRLMEGMEYYTAPVKSNDYETLTRHYNASGHKKHGDLILELIGK